MNLVQFVGKSFNVEKENKNDCVVKETEIRERGCKLEHKTCDILAAERLRLMRFDNRLIIDSFQEDIWVSFCTAGKMAV